MREIVVGSRRSDLALTQSNWVMDELSKQDQSVNIRLEKIVTKGDEIVDVTLSKVGGKGLFVKEIEQALLDKKIDFAVHSMKDLPASLAKGTVIAAVPKRLSPLDCLISKSGLPLKQLRPGAVVGTSSLRRQAQVLAQRPDLQVKPIRGNIDTRLKKLKTEDFDAIVLAVAGLTRVNWEDKITERLPAGIVLPAVGQGALAIQCREEDDDLIQLLKKIHHPQTEQLTNAERSFLITFQGGCHLPIGGYAEQIEEQIFLTGYVSNPNGQKMIKESIRGTDAQKLGQQLAEKMIELGAKELLATV